VIILVLHLLRLRPFLVGGHRQLALENLALRQQLAVYERTAPRPRLRPMDRLFYVDYPLAGQPAVTYTFDAADRRTQITRNATTVTYAHDDANRRASLTPLGTLTYGYDPGATGSRSAGRGHAAGLRRVVVTKARRLTPIKPAPA
jgi:hypothetical protein